MVGVLLGAIVFGHLADRSVLGRAQGRGWDRGPWAGRRALVGGWHPPHRTSGPSTPVPAQPRALVLRTLVQGLPPRRLGRRKVLILSHLQMAASGTCTAFAPSFPVYCAFRLLSGMSTSGIILNSMTLSEGCWEDGVPTPSPLATQPPPSPPSWALPALASGSALQTASQPLGCGGSHHPDPHSDTGLRTPSLGTGRSRPAPPRDDCSRPGAGALKEPGGLYPEESHHPEAPARGCPPRPPPTGLPTPFYYVKYPNFPMWQLIPVLLTGRGGLM